MTGLFFNTGIRGIFAGLGMLALRLSAGGLMLWLHGWSKWQEYDDKASGFPDPLNIGSELSLSFTVTAEVLCAGLICVGLFTRWASLGAAFTMAIAAFVVHADDPLSTKELALVYCAAYTAILCVGPGMFSLDRLFHRPEI